MPILRRSVVQFCSAPLVRFHTALDTFDEWTEVFGSERLTGALLDRLTHRVHILEMNGESYRLKQSRQAAPVRAASDPADA